MTKVQDGLNGSPNGLSKAAGTAAVAEAVPNVEQVSTVDVPAAGKVLGARALVRMLIEQGVEFVFGVPGDTSLGFYEALYDARPAIRHVMARDERSATFMADAYARLSHRPGVCECPSGAGALYSVPGVAEANSSSIPVILLSSGVPLSGEGKGMIT